MKVRVTYKHGLNIRTAPHYDGHIVRVAAMGEEIEINPDMTSAGDWVGEADGNWIKREFTEPVEEISVKTPAEDPTAGNKGKGKAEKAVSDEADGKE